MPYNVWAGGEYSNNTSGLSTVADWVTVSSDFSANGDKSFKVDFQSSTFNTFEISRTSVEADETYSASFKILNNSGKSITLRLLHIEQSQQTETVIPSSDTVQTITSTVNTSDSGTLSFRLVSANLLTFYIDDLNLVKS